MDIATNATALRNGISGIKRHRFNGMEGSFFASVIEENLLNDTFRKAIPIKDNFTKLEKMLLLAMFPLTEKNRITDRTALILSTTKGNISGLASGRNPHELRLPALAEKLADFYGFPNIPIVISNACVSGILAVSVAKRLVESGMYDDVCVVAGDEVSPFIASGFQAFQALSHEPCRPFDTDRSGVSLGEAAAATWVSAERNQNSFRICGEASINDANHISGPSRTGEGLFKSIKNALTEAGISPAEIGFISAHGTATRYNDDMESIAFARSSFSNTLVHSLKGCYGHTLGASGLLELVIAMENASRNSLVPSLGFQTAGTTEPMNIIQQNTEKDVRYFLKTASGFGGCNTAVVFEKLD